MPGCLYMIKRMSQSDVSLPTDTPVPHRTHWLAMVAGIASLAVLAVAGLAVLPASGDAVPSKVLQAVDVDLGTDGSIFGVNAMNVRRTAGTTTTDRVSLDPNKVASSLPLRILTSYVLDVDGRRTTGTNLKDLSGRRGVVTVDITVQNTTVRPQLLSYDVDGVKHTRYALVGTPMTVTAAATLTKDNFDKVTPRTATVPGTNGVVGHTREGATTVQWAAILAPPQLSSSATFTLVEDTSSFRLPRLDISAQPGLATDTSVNRLLKDAFREDGSSKLNLEIKTIDTIQNVSGVLGGATKTLDDIKTSLSTGAHTLGQSLIGELAGSADQVVGASTQLSTGLDGLKTDLTSSLTSSNSATTRSLLGAVTTLSDYIGHPTGAQPTALPVAGGCTITLPPVSRADATLYAQFVRVSQQLKTLAAATSGCKATIQAQLLASFGDPNHCASGVGLTCRLLALQSQLSGVVRYVATEGAAVVAQFDPRAVDGVRTALATLTAKVSDIQTAAAALTTGTTPTSVLTAVQGIITKVTAARDELVPRRGALALALATINDQAKARLTEIGGATGNPATVAGQARALGAAICATPTALPSADPETQAYIATLRSLVTGTSCGASPAPVTPLPGYPTPLVDRIAADRDAWATVDAMTDLSTHAPQGVALEVAQLKTALDGVLDDLAELELLVADSPTGSLKSKIDALTALVAGLYHAPQAGTGCPAAAADPSLPALNALGATFTTLDCNQAGLADHLAQVFVTATPTYNQAASGVGQAAVDSNRARLAADASLESLLGTLDGSLDATAARSLQDGSGLITSQQSGLHGTSATLTAQLDRDTAEQVLTIGSSLRQSNQDIKASTDTLARSIRLVQQDLGSGNSSDGLLGVIVLNASLTDTGSARVAAASRTAQRFGGVRGSELEDILLQQAQFAAALRAQAAQPPFALTLPSGSTSSAVYSFHLRAV